MLAGSGVSTQLIADSSHRHNQFWLCGIFLDLLTQRVNVNIERVFLEGIAFSPYAIQHLLPREDATWRFEEIPKNLKLLWSEVDELALDPHLVAFEIHLHFASGTLGGALRWQFLSAQNSTYSRNQRFRRLITECQVYATFKV